MARKEVLREFKRKFIHILGVLAITPLIFLELSLAVKVFAVFVLLALFSHWYYNQRLEREKYFKELVGDLQVPKAQKHEILRTVKEVRKFEEQVIFGFLKEVKRRREKEPLLATFYYLFSTFMTLILFGAPFAAFGLIAVAIGDAAASLVGKYCGRHKLRWNKEKSVEGWIGFFAATAISIFIFLQFMPQFAVFNPLWLAIAAGITGATIETIPTVNDNTIIPLGVGFVIWLLALLL
jgi:dolichol kinase